ncbi:MAG: prolyl oligopeptidase family serine peptidase [Chloroflexota bacterium]
MSRWLKIITAILLVLALMPILPARAKAAAPCDFYSVQKNGAIYCIEMPVTGTWNGGLVVFAHGYVPVTAGIDIPWSQMVLSDGTYLPDLVNSMGYAFATTSYSVNGLAVTQGQRDILNLMEYFKEKVAKPRRAYLVGASEGGLITTLLIENHPKVFNGGMAMCAPIGDFKAQINYWGNFRVAFDYYLPGVLPPSAVNIPQPLIDNWDTQTAPGIGYALSITDPATIGKLLAVTGAPIDPADPISSTPATVLGLLWYNVFATNNGVDVLHGQPFDNHKFLYMDPALNLAAARFSADKKALQRIKENYQTTGRLKTALVTLHTTGDPIVPYSQVTRYGQKVLANKKSAAYLNIPVQRYGHCNFTTSEVLGGFSWLVSQPTK